MVETGLAVARFHDVPEVRQADTDAQLVEMWLRDRPDRTAAAYKEEVDRFLPAVGKPLQAVTLRDLQAYFDIRAEVIRQEQAASGGRQRAVKDWHDLSLNSRNRARAILRSLFSFAEDLGYIRFNVGARLLVEKVENERAQRILEEVDVLRMIDREQDARNRTILRLFYNSGIRVSELAGLTWSKCTPAANGGGVLTVFGKGRKTRHVNVKPSVWSDLQALRPALVDDTASPWVSSKTGASLSACQIWRIVKAAADRAGLSHKVSPHWLRHAHAKHALNRGCPVHVLQATLGHASLATTSIYADITPGESSGNYLAG